MQEYDYSHAIYYFVTICTQNRKHIFGEISDDCIKNIPQYFPNAKIDYYCLMPNHIHFIIIIEDNSGTAYRVPTFKTL